MENILSTYWGASEKIISRDKLNIVLLAHVQEPRGHINQEQIQCAETERFSIDEFNEIYQGIVSAGYYIQAVYFNELDFIADFIEHPNHFEYCLIYNLARNGLRTNKKVLIPAFCELINLNYVTSSSLSCALCRNKYYFSTLLMNHGIPVPKSWFLTEAGSWLHDAPADKTNVICKPAAGSASQGVTDAGIFSASQSMFKRLKGASYIVQEYIDGSECEVPVFSYGNTIKALSPVGIALGENRILNERMSQENQYDFYDLSDTQPSTTINAIKAYAEKAFYILQMNTYGRIDFRIDAKGEPYIFDIATMPYTTKHSSFAFAFEKMGLPYSSIYQAIISAALQRPEVRF